MTNTQKLQSLVLITGYTEDDIAGILEEMELDGDDDFDSANINAFVEGAVNILIKMKNNSVKRISEGDYSVEYENSISDWLAILASRYTVPIPGQSTLKAVKWY